jgi:hypothetical protein
MTGRGGKHMRCERHGRIAWELTIMCGGCGRFYQIVPDGQEFKPLCEGAVQALERCECGKRLAPEAGVQGGGIFWARSVCTDCFKDKMVIAHARAIKLVTHEVSVDMADVQEAMRQSALEDGYTGALPGPKVVTSAEEIVDHIIKTTHAPKSTG